MLLTKEFREKMIEVSKKSMLRKSSFYVFILLVVVAGLFAGFYFVKAQTAPAMPTGFGSSSLVGSINVSWSPVSGAAYYDLQRITTGGVYTWLPGYVDTHTAFVDTNNLISGNQYTYKVSACIAGGSCSGYAYTTVTYGGSTPTPTPTPTPTYSSSYGGLSGSIYASDGSTIYSSVTVSLYTDSAATNLYQSTTVTSGGYYFSSLPYGTYYLRAVSNAVSLSFGPATTVVGSTSNTHNIYFGSSATGTSGDSSGSGSGTTTTTSYGSIGGYVYNQSNMSAVYGATVSIHKDSLSNAATSTYTLTSTSNYFYFGSLAYGNYWVKVSASGYNNYSSSNYYGVQSTAQVTANVYLTQTATPTPTPTTTATLYGNVNGHVYDSVNRTTAVYGATLYLYQGSTTGTYYRGPMTMTSTATSFDFASLPSGHTYYVKATKAGYSDSWSAGAYISGAMSAPADVYMSAGTSITPTPTPTPTTGSTLTGTISVQVMNTDQSQMISGATVYLCRNPYITSDCSTQVLSGYSHTFNAISYGTYYLKAIKTGYTETSFVTVTLGSSVNSQILMLGGGSPIITPTPTPTPTITTGAGFYGCVTDLNNLPLLGATIKVYTDTARTAMRTSMLTDSAGGCYNITGLTAGATYYLRATYGNYSDDKTATLGLAAFNQSFRIPTTSTIAPTPTPVPTTTTTANANIHGTITDSAGSPLLNARIELYKTDTDKSAGIAYKSAYVSAQSTGITEFFFSDVPQATYFIRVYPPSTRTDLLYLDGQMVVNSMAMSGITYKLNAATVTAETNGAINIQLYNPISYEFESAYVTVYDSAGNKKGGSSGAVNHNFELRGLPYGKYRVVVSSALSGFMLKTTEQWVEINQMQNFAWAKFEFYQPTTTAAKISITGSVVDGISGSPLADLANAGIKLRSTTGSGNTFLGSVTNGKYEIYPIADSYEVLMEIPPDYGYYFVPFKVTISSAQAGMVYDLKLFRNNYLVYGNFIDRNLVTLTNLPAGTKIFAAKDGQTYYGMVDYAMGGYKIKVPNPGVYTVSAFVGTDQGYFVENQSFQVTFDTTAVTQRKMDVRVLKSQSVIKGKALKPDGSPLADAWIEVGRFSSSESVVTAQLTTIKQDGMVSGARSDANGDFEVFAPWGTYYLRAYLPPEKGYLNPDETTVTVSSTGQSPADLKLTFKQSNITISGNVIFSDSQGGASGAFVDAWSNKGGYVKTLSSTGGAYTLKVSGNDVWHIKAVNEENLTVYKSAEVEVSVSSGLISGRSLVLVRERSVLPEIVQKTYLATQYQSLESTNGARVEAPANSVVSGGQVDLSMQATAEAPQQGTSKPIGFAYDVKAVVNSTEIKSLASEITIRIPYSDDDLKGTGLTVEQLTPSYFDESAGAWKKADKYVIDKVGRFFIIYTSHLTRFALLAPADTTPPTDPSNVKIASSGSTSLLLTWTEPSFDYHHTRIYRSTVAGQVGTLTYDSVTGGSKTDTNLTTGKTYYYVLRSVDPFGNESSNTATLAGIPGAATQPSSTTVQEGDLVRGPDGIKVYIVNGFGFKRHIFNPAVFKMYAHFKWDQVKSLTQTELDAYKSSDFYRGEGDAKVFSLEEVDEAKGIAKKRWLDISAEEFIRRGYSWDQVFNINTVEKNYYGTGDPIK